MGNEFPGGRRRTHRSSNSRGCCVFSTCLNTFRPCVCRQGFVGPAIVGGVVVFVVVAIDCCAVAELELVFTSSFGWWGPAALAGFFFSSMSVAAG